MFARVYPVSEADALEVAAHDGNATRHRSATDGRTQAESVSPSLPIQLAILLQLPVARLAPVGRWVGGREAVVKFMCGHWRGEASQPMSETASACYK